MAGWMEKFADPMDAEKNDGISTAIRHALGWLVFGNSVGILLSILLLKPEWQLGEWTYGRWVPVHLNAQLYGWTALPLVAWLFHLYAVNTSSVRHWAAASVWGWTAALALAALHWLMGESSGKIFLDWKNGALWGFVAALIGLWIVLLWSWLEQSQAWTKLHRTGSLAGLIGLASVPVMMIVAASPHRYPPIDRTTGGPTGSSLLGSTLIVIGLMLLLPRVTMTKGKGGAGQKTWGFFLISWVVFAIIESIGGSHFDARELFAMLLLLPWAWLIPHDWKGFAWPEESAIWRHAMLGWWGLLVLSGLIMYAPGILDHLKFTHALVAHSHLAMAGFTTSFCALLISLLTGHTLGGWKSTVAWHAAALVMIGVLGCLGWREGSSVEWMNIAAPWREIGLTARLLCGLILWCASVSWLIKFLKS